MKTRMTIEDFNKHFCSTIVEDTQNDRIVQVLEGYHDEVDDYRQVQVQDCATGDVNIISEEFLKPWFPENGYYVIDDVLVQITQIPVRQWKLSFHRNNYQGSICDYVYAICVREASPFRIEDHVLDLYAQRSPERVTEFESISTKLLAQVLSRKYALINTMFSKVPLLVNDTSIIGQVIENKLHLHPRAEMLRSDLLQYAEVA